MAEVFTADLIDSIYEGIDEWSTVGLNSVPKIYSQIFDTMKADKRDMTHMTFAEIGLLPVRKDGDDYRPDEFHQGFKKIFTAVQHAGGYEIHENAVKDNLYPQLVKLRSQQTGRAAITTKNIVGTELYNDAFTTTGVAPDGLELCSDAHLLERGGTYRNELAISSAMSETALETMINDIQKQLKTGNGFIMGASEDKLLVPTELQWKAKRILNSDKQNDTMLNATNALKGSFPGGVIVNRHLTSSTAYFAITDVPSGMLHYERDPITVEMDTKFSNDLVMVKVKYRDSFGCATPAKVFGSPGTA